LPADPGLKQVVFDEERNDGKIGVYVWQGEPRWDRTNPTPAERKRDPEANVLVGAAAVQLCRKRTRAAATSICFTMHGMGVNRSAYGHGLCGPNGLLFRTVDEACFETAQDEHSRLWLLGEQVPAVMDLSIGCRVPPLCLKRFESIIGPKPFNVGYLYPGAYGVQKITGFEAALRPGTGNTINRAIRVQTASCKMGPSGELPSDAHGLQGHVLPAKYCNNLQRHLDNPANRGIDDDGNHYVQVGKAQLKGFDTYGNIQAAAHDPSLQAAKTYRTHTKAEVTELLKSAPGFADLAHSVLAKLGYSGSAIGKEGLCGSYLDSVHFFYVDDTRQTSFDWHSDDEDLKIKRMRKKWCLRSAVIQLGAESPSAMQMHSFRPFIFSGRGACAIFHGSAIHRSVNIKPTPKGGVWKVTLFFMLPEEDVSPPC
jgi:hypothetical protein